MAPRKGWPAMLEIKSLEAGYGETLILRVDRYSCGIDAELFQKRVVDRALEAADAVAAEAALLPPVEQDHCGDDNSAQRQQA
jgi:hypothetical protein